MVDQSVFLESLKPTEDEISQNHGWRERYEGQEAEGLREAAAHVITDLERALAALISKAAHDLIVEFEVGNADYYHKNYEHPTWPEGASGITIGIGYDLGYNVEPDFVSAWGAHLPAADLDALKPALQRKGERARDFLGNVKSISVPWAAADSVFRHATLPTFAGQTAMAFPGCELLNGTCFGALVSLVYNRGPKLSGPSRTEMKAIHDAIRAGNVERVPGLIRAMCRLWPKVRGLIRRREAEANLFERGLAELAAQRRQVAQAAAAGAAGAGSLQESIHGTWFEGVPQTQAALHDGDGGSISDRDYQAVQPQEWTRDTGLQEASPPAWAAVRWAADDALNVCYGHLLEKDRGSVKGAGFTLSADDLDLLIQANGFDTLCVERNSEKRIIFGLRGTLLDFDTSSLEDKYQQVQRQKLRLKSCRPDHKNFRCVIGVYDTESRMLSGFMASTVPNRGSVNRCKEIGKDGNLLATGCYVYEVGAHSKGRYPGCLRQAQGVAVLRSRKDLVYDVNDVWDVSATPDEWPMDNIHPAFADGTYGSAEFSSFGCQVIRGSFDSGNYTQQFKVFRDALGLRKPGTDNGRRFNYVLLTGDEAALATTLNSQSLHDGQAPVRTSLVRIRQGSAGPAVRQLQAALRQKVDGLFSAANKKALIELQRAQSLAGDGIYSPALDGKLKLAVFAPTPVVVASAAPLTEAVPSAPALIDAAYYNIGRRAEIAESEPGLLTAPVLPHYEAISQESWTGLIDRGKRAVDRAERTLHEVICGDSENDVSDRANVRRALLKAIGGKRDDVVAQIGRLITSVLMIPQIVSQPIAEILYDRFTPLVSDQSGAAGEAVIGRFCVHWAERLHPEAKAAPDVSKRDEKPKAGPSDAIIDKIRTAAESGDWAQVQAQMSDLRKVVRDDGRGMSGQEAVGLVDALSSGMTLGPGALGGADTGAVFGEIDAQLKAVPLDSEALQTSLDALYGLLADPTVVIDEAKLLGVISTLRSKRMFDLLAKVGDRSITRFPGNIRFKRFYAQALIDQGQVHAALKMLEAEIAALEPKIAAGSANATESGEFKELYGLLGRGNKQIYVDNVPGGSMPDRVRALYKPYLKRAIECYARIYERGSAGEEHWHGVNLAALLRNAAQDNHEDLIGLSKKPYRTIATDIIETQKAAADSKKDAWTIASVAEAFLINGDAASALHYIRSYVEQPDADAFAVAGTARQFNEVLRIDPGKSGSDIVTLLKAKLVATREAKFSLDGDTLRQQGIDTTVLRETMVEGGAYAPLTVLATVVDRARAIGAVVDEKGKTRGTGFLVKGRAICTRWDDGVYLITNCHVLSCESWPEEHLNTAPLRPTTVRVVMEAAGGVSLQLDRTARYLSRPSLLDVAIVRVLGDTSHLKTLEFYPADEELRGEDRRNPTTVPCTTVSVIGCPLGGPLSLSVVGNLTGAKGVLLDIGPRSANGNDPRYLHYRAPTEHGNSGSPVFEANTWQVIGLHHEGFDQFAGRPRLNGQTGVNYGNEGISIHSIRRHVEWSGR